ncbi:MAG: desulfoferrodoxin family protein [Deltaproteobacteria bacterium]|nr:desulfoferrodoxin family protein [Deltaproteobacteria bacterium]
MNHPRLMKHRQLALGFIPIFLLFFFPMDEALADKAAVTIEAPAEAAKGGEITIVLNVTHSADNFFHHVNWVEVWLNGQTAFRWEYPAFDLPSAATFKKEIKMKVEGDTEIKAEANCNIHGSKGPAIVNLKTKE